MAIPAKFLVSQLSEDNYIPYLCERIEAVANEAISSRGVFRIGVSGGSLISFLAQGLPNIKTDWKGWKMFLCDERLVPEDDEESTFGQFKKKLFPLLPLFPYEDNFIPANTGLDGVEAGKEYEGKLRALWSGEDEEKASYGMADCLLLGLGPDGHTCSLFPNHPILDVKDCWVTNIEDSPKPPKARITLTYPFINKATNILIVGKGKEKWDILQKVQNGEDFPIGRVDNPGGHLEWILNEVK